MTVPINGVRRPMPRMTWVSHPRVAQLLRMHDCSVVGVLADIAKDKAIDPALRFRAVERLVGLLYLPSVPVDAADSPKAGEAAVADKEVAAIIAEAWPKAPKP